ncbi:hypothetical protein F8388_005113 [Cannabis sativa]|uniref:Uncharacterized protein n=1 Tax=Cannabis sativa TaxID=3483 RepID=A0A7J6DUU9_CANSA|nr:hypothetical protein F8388_005113 [Cannabis sativa]
MVIRSTDNQLEFGSDDHQILVGGDNYKQDFSSESNSSYSTITTSEDKASVLGDAIVYVKQLQERVNILEEQSKSRTVESVGRSNNDQDYNHNNNNDNNQTLTLLPEIEARVYEKDVLIRIHCENHKGIVVKILSEIEKLDHHLSVVNTSVMPFGNCTLDITILAQMEKEFSMTFYEL